MGKAQSKRSVDITTEGKKEEEVIHGKMEKIEDAEDQKPQVNGDATPQESDAKEKKETEESENDKDATTEKSSADVGGGGGDQAAQSQQNGEHNGEKEGETAAVVPNATTPKEETTKEGDEAAVGAEEAISPLADDSSKKTKKEKVKKKWSFRSISFGKKDKQKPAKTDADAVSPTTNGENNDKPADGATTTEETKKEEVGDAKPPTENGNASEKELLNGDGGETTTTTTTPTEDKSTTVATNNESTNETAAANAVATTNNTTASSSTTTSPSTAPVAAVAETENKIAVAANDVATPILSNGNADEIKNDIASDDKPKLNGTNGQEHAAEDDEEKTHAVDIKAVSKSIEYHNTNSFDKKIPTIIEETVVNDGDGDGEGAGDDGAITNFNSNIKATDEIVEDIGAGGDIGEAKCEETFVIEEKFIEPAPPLPISPPPSQMVAFALNPELAGTEVVDNLEKVETAQPTKMSIADLESEFKEQTDVQSMTNIEKPTEEIVPNKDFVEHINDIKVEERVEMTKDETLVLNDEPITGVEIEITEVQDVDGIVDNLDEPTVLAAASILVDEVTVKAAEIVAYKLDENVDVEDELPPPPPSPPSGQECFEQCEDNGTVEYVLNQFESKINEIEQKVMNNDNMPDHFEMSEDNSEQITDEENKIHNLNGDNEKNSKECTEIEEQKQFELCETEIPELETVETEMPELETVETDMDEPQYYDTEITQYIKMEDNETAEIIEIVEIVPENPIESEIKSEEQIDYNLEDTVKENGTEKQEAPVKDEIETETSVTKQNDNETEAQVKQEIKEIETNKTEMNENGNLATEKDENETNTSEIKHNGNESHIEQNRNKTQNNNNNNNNEEIDATAIIMEQINNLTLNDKIISETTFDDKTNTAADDEKFVKDSGDITNKPQLIDFENVKEIDPIELKEAAAAAAEIKTQDLAVSCE